MLPPYPELVTKLTTIKVNQPQHRSPENYVKHILQLPVKDRRYARDEFGTKCNFYTHDVLHVMGYPVAFMRAKDYLKMWRLKGSPLQKMVIQDAITNANMGCPTVFGVDMPGDTDHVGVVLPQNPTDIIADVLIANVGSSNFYGKSLRWAVPAAQIPLVEFFGGP